MDLDIVILHNFDEEILSVLKAGEEMNCVSDAIHWMGEKFKLINDAFQAAPQAHIFESYLEADDDLVNRPGGDQVWAGPQLTSVSYG